MLWGGGKGPLIQKDKSATLSTLQDQTLFQPVGVDGYNATETGDVSATLGVNCGMSTGRNGVCIIENHPADSRVNIDETGTVQTLTSRMGTGGGNVPMVLETRGCHYDA